VGSGGATSIGGGALFSLGEVTGLGAFCGSTGEAGLTAAFSGEGLADGVAGPVGTVTGPRANAG